MTWRDWRGYTWEVCKHPWGYAQYLWRKYLWPSTFSGWMCWYVNDKTRTEIIRNGWHEDIWNADEQIRRS